jgi:hypothetical protein
MAAVIERLSAQEVADLAGCETPRRQVNVLKEAGIHCYINARREVVVLRAWAERAGTSPERTAVNKPSTAKPKTVLKLPLHRLDDLNDARH